MIYQIPLPPAEAIPFSLEAWQSGNYEVIYRNGEKPLRVIHVPEHPVEDERILSVREAIGFEYHFDTGKLWYDDKNFDLLLLPKAAAEPLRGKYVVYHKCAIHDTMMDAEYELKGCTDKNYHIIHFK
jgi:hypothetical protein